MTERKTQISRAGLAVFARYGLRRTTMEDVAVEAGLSRPALYQYFRNKDDLLGACFDLVSQDGLELSEAAAKAQSDPAARVSAYLVAYMTYYHRLLISGPHSEDVLELKSRFGPDKIIETREALISRLNALAEVPNGDEKGVILAHAGEGLKMLAPDEAVLAKRLRLLISAVLAT